MVFSGITGLTAVTDKWKFQGSVAWIAGALSGVFGGLVGNQGGIRSAAMLGFELKQMEFVATATGIAFVVDLVRMPVYFLTQGRDILNIGPLIVIAAIGVMAGTFLGGIVLHKMPEAVFKKVVSGIILVIGIFVLIHR